MRIDVGVEHDVVASADADRGGAAVGCCGDRLAIALVDNNAAGGRGQDDVLAVLASRDGLVDIEVARGADAHRREDL